MKTLTKNEPVALSAGVLVLAQAVMVVLTMFNVVELSAEQQAAVMGLITAVISVIGAIIARKKVTPTDNIPVVDAEEII